MTASQRNDVRINSTSEGNALFPPPGINLLGWLFQSRRGFTLDRMVDERLPLDFGWGKHPIARPRFYEYGKCSQKETFLPAIIAPSQAEVVTAK